MRGNLLKKKRYSVALLIIFLLSIIAADYYELFGATVEKKLSFAEILFRTLDEDTGTPIMEVGVRCFQKNNMNACARKESQRVGIVSVNIPVQRAIKSTLFFKKAEEIYKSIDPKINIMLIHQNYHNPTVSLLMEDIYSNKVTEQTVKMTPRAWPDNTVEEE